VSRIVTFTNLFPSSAMPTHGLFVHDRMHRVAAAGGFGWQVVAPVPDVVWPLRRSADAAWRRTPLHECWQGVEVSHPRWRHWPGCIRRQARAVADGARGVVAALAQREPIVLDAHYLWPDGVAAAALARELRVPYTLTARGSDVNVLAQQPALRARIADAAAGAHACFAVSRDLAERFADAAGLPRAGVEVARNGVDLQRFSPGDAVAARRALGLPDDGFLVLGVGRLVANKGFATAARAVASLPSTARLVLVGDGPERAAIAGLAPSTIFLGAQPPSRVALACRACDVLALPSEREGWPNVVTEALASGLPVVATPVGGVPEILGDPPPPWLGAVCAPGDVAAFAAALSALAAAPADRARVRAYAERFGWDAPVARLCAVFRQAFAKGAA
jgi:teichuronic acid biosynthesis glycosyltransferase TuaC